MNIVFFALLGVGVIALVGSAYAFERVTKGDRYDVVIGLTHLGELWILARRAGDGWHRSSLGRSLLIIPIGSGITAILIHASSE